MLCSTIRDVQDSPEMKNLCKNFTSEKLEKIALKSSFFPSRSYSVSPRTSQRQAQGRNSRERRGNVFSAIARALSPCTYCAPDVAGELLICRSYFCCRSVYKFAAAVSGSAVNHSEPRAELSLHTRALRRALHCRREILLYAIPIERERRRWPENFASRMKSGFVGG